MGQTHDFAGFSDSTQATAFPLLHVGNFAAQDLNQAKGERTKSRLPPFTIEVRKHERRCQNQAALCPLTLYFQNRNLDRVKRTFFRIHFFHSYRDLVLRHPPYPL